MYEPFQMSIQEKDNAVDIMEEQCTLNIFENVSDEDGIDIPSIFTEAVFTGGKETCKPIVDQFQIIKDALENEIKKDGSKFNPMGFYKNTIFRDLESVLIKVFGFRDVEIGTMIEGYHPETDDFQTKMLNAFTWVGGNIRFPAEAIVTDKGFYDSTHTIRGMICFTLGVIHHLSAEELTAILLHELGHNIDPALIDIRYTETNILSKYLTDRVGKINNGEKSYLSKKKKSLVIISPDLIILILFGLAMGISALVSLLQKIFFKKEKAIEKIKNLVKNDIEKYDRVNSIEAYADNFARMYGFGSPLMTGINKIGTSNLDQQMSRLKKEKRRQKAIADMAIAQIRDMHKTDIHRINSLVKEYEADLKDPNIPQPVKDEIKTDLEELKAVLDKYLNHKDEFQRTVNRIIKEGLESQGTDEKDVKSDKTDSEEQSEDPKEPDTDENE